MKFKTLIILCVLIMAGLVMPLYANEGVNININTGYFGIGGNFPLRGDYDLEMNFSILNFGLEAIDGRLGFELSPFMVYGWAGSDGSELSALSLINFRAYWNIINSNLFFGPFAFVNYMFIDQDFHWDRYALITGLQIGFRVSTGNINYNIVVGELGYRNIDGNHRYHFGVKIDIFSFFLGTLISSMNITFERPLNRLK